MKLRFLRVALYPVKCFRIVAQNLFHETRRQIFARSHLRHQMSLFRRIIVAVVGAGEQVTFTGVLDQVGMSSSASQATKKRQSSKRSAGDCHDAFQRLVLSRRSLWIKYGIQLADASMKPKRSLGNMSGI